MWTSISGFSFHLLLTDHRERRSSGINASASWNAISYHYSRSVKLALNEKEIISRRRALWQPVALLGAPLCLLFPTGFRRFSTTLLHCPLASCGAVYFNRSCLWPGLWVCVFVCASVACIDPHQTGFVCKDSDHLHLIKFWPSRAPGKGVCGGAKIFVSALLQPARSVCVSLSAFFICTENRGVECAVLNRSIDVCIY